MTGRSIECGCSKAGKLKPANWDFTGQKAVEEQYQKIVETTNEGIWVIDAEGRTSYTNRRMAQMLGCTVEKLAVKNAFDFVFPEDRPRGQQEFDLRKMESEGCQVQFRYRKKDGSELWTLVSTSLIRGSDGSVEGILGMFTDITELKRVQDELADLNRTLAYRVDVRTNKLKKAMKNLLRMQKELVASEIKYRSLAENTRDILVSMDAEGVITCISPQISRYGINPEGIIGHQLLDFVFHEDRETVASKLEHAQVSQEIEAFEWRISPPEGNAHWFEFSGEVQRDEDKGVTSITGVLRDISERKATETELREAQNRSIELEASLVSAQDEEQQRIADGLHDQVSQLLAAAKMKHALLCTDRDDPKERKTHQEIQEHLTEALESVRSLSFEMKTSMLIRLGLLDAIKELCTAMENRYRVHFDFKAEDTEFHISAEVSVILFKGIRELIFNVVKHANVQRAVVSMKKVKNFLQITVVDQGRGFHIPTGDEGQLLERGVGLFSVRERLGDIGRKMEIDSSPGSHTRVTLWAPFQDAPHSP